MRSTILLTVRAMVMLTSLVAFPLIAVLGLPLPEDMLALAARAGDVCSRIVDSAREVMAKDPTRAVAAKAIAYDEPAPLGPSRLDSPVIAGLLPPEQPAHFRHGPEPSVEPPTGPIAVPPPAQPPTAKQAGVAGARERLEVLERRFRELGATYYVLETWGETDELYRFRGEVAIHNDPHFHRYFEAVDPDPAGAMGRVLDEVEAWRTGELP